MTTTTTRPANLILKAKTSRSHLYAIAAPVPDGYWECCEIWQRWAGTWSCIDAVQSPAGEALGQATRHVASLARSLRAAR